MLRPQNQHFPLQTRVAACNPSSTARCLEGCNRNTQLMVQEQHEQMVLQHSHIPYFSTHQHLLSNPLSLFSFLGTNYYILTFICFDITSMPSILTAWVYTTKLCVVLGLLISTVVSKRRDRPSASLKIYNPICKNSLPFKKNIQANTYH